MPKMWESIKIWLQINWKSVLKFCAGIVIWLLAKDNIPVISYPVWGYLIFSGLKLDGIDGGATGLTTPNIDGASFSISIWVKRNSLSSGPGDFHFLVSKGSNLVANQLMHVGFNDDDGASRDNQIKFNFFANDLQGSGVKDLNSHHYCFTYNASTNARKIYMDGSLDASDTASADITNTSGDDWLLGKRNGALFADADITELDIYSRELTADEVALLYGSRQKKRAHDIQKADLEISLQMEGPDGNSAASATIPDSTENGNDFTGDAGTGIDWAKETVLSFPPDEPVSIIPVVVVAPIAIGAMSHQIGSNPIQEYGLGANN